jgi:hypothetical protein
VGPVLWRGSGGEAQAGVGDHGGGVNLTGGDLGWPVHGAVAGAHGGEVAGEAAERNRRWGWVRCDREWRSSSTKLIRLKATKEERTKLTGVKGERGGASSIGLGEEWRRWSGLVWRKQSSGGPFCRRTGGGRKGGDDERRRARHAGGDGANDDEMARAGRG